MRLENHLQNQNPEKQPGFRSPTSCSENSFSGTTIINILLIIILLSIPDFSFGQTVGSITIRGSVNDHRGEPLSFVNVYLEGTSAGNVTGSEGQFSFTTNLTGRYTLAASLIGFETTKKSLTLEQGETYELEVTLKEELLDLGSANITASSFTTGEVEGVTLSPTEVVTTPGAAADIFRALQTFPGVSSLNEGSGLFVRGGDVSETKILLDQATVVHPYKYETPTGGVFGTIPPFLVSGTFFSTGGFPARYGNALSGVLSMQSRGMPERNTGELNLGLAAASAGISAQIIPDKLGINFSGNRSFTETMFKVNGQSDQFTEAPSSTDLNLNLIYKPNPSSTVKAFSYITKNQVGVSVEEPSFLGNYKGDEFNQLYNLQWTQWFDESEWMMENSVSMNRFSSTSTLGVLDITERDLTYKFRSDAEHRLSDMFKFYTGGEVVHKENDFTGNVPKNEHVVDSSASFYALDEQYGTTRMGVYTELDIKPDYHWLINLGIRSDYHHLAEYFTADPRLTIKYQFNKTTNLRASTGLFHQFPQPYQFNEENGNPALGAQQAMHYIFGFEHEADLWHFRAEGYYKDYTQLVIPDNENHLSNQGYGDTKGLDFFLRYSRFLQSRFNGWISYSLLKSQRYQARDVGGRYEFEEAPSDFDITHNLNVVGKFRITGMFYGGLSYQFSTGRPYTPVIDARQSPGQNYYLPVEGAVNANRLPNFQRMDLNLSYYWALPQNQSVTFYMSVSNVLDRDNVTGYTYNQDYSTKSPVYSNFSRFVYAGVTANLNL